MVMVWLEISGWFPALEPMILNVCTLGLKSVHLDMGSHVFTEKGQKIGIPFVLNLCRLAC